MSIWREPSEESDDLYPGLVVRDARVSGSITTGPSRLPLWAFISTAIQDGWDEVEKGWNPSQYGWTDVEMAGFLYSLLQLRGEFARLLLMLAEAERSELETDLDGEPWWTQQQITKPIAAQLRRCISALER